MKSKSLVNKVVDCFYNFDDSEFEFELMENNKPISEDKKKISDVIEKPCCWCYDQGSPHPECPWFNKNGYCNSGMQYDKYPRILKYFKSNEMDNIKDIMEVRSNPYKPTIPFHIYMNLLSIGDHKIKRFY